MTYTIPTKPRDFFTWEEYRDANLIVPGGISIINGGRDIGKTTGAFIAWLRLANTEEMLFYVRNTLKEIEAYRKSFNAQYGTEFYMTNTEIWTVERVELLNKKTGKIEIDYRKKDVIGFVASLNGTDGWRSANFNKIKYIFSDEYNQIGNSLNFEKFMTLWTSVLRTKNNVYTLLIGNRDDASSEIIVELGIDILVPEDYQGDWVVPLLPNDPDFKDKCYFIDLDDSRFNNNQVKTVWKALGRTSSKMGKYYDRGYKSYDNIDCRHLPKETMAHVNWDWSYKSGGYRMIAGKLQDLIVIHLDTNNEYKAPTQYGETLQSYIDKSLTDIEGGGYHHIFWYIVNAASEHNIVYTSIAAKEEANDFLENIALIIKEETFNL